VASIRVFEFPWHPPAFQSRAMRGHRGGGSGRRRSGR
jgi:hypothetical protein